MIGLEGESFLNLVAELVDDDVLFLAILVGLFFPVI